MPSYEFKENDLFYNTIETYPQVQFDVNDGNVYLNNKNNIPGAHVPNVGHVPTGFTSLYELNVDRDFSAQTYNPKTNPDGIKSRIFPFVTKNGSFEAVGNVSVKDYFNSFEYGDIITGSYPMSASLVRCCPNIPSCQFVLALRNTLDYYTYMSPNYAFSSSLRDLATIDVNLLDVPSIFYGSQIRRGSVQLKFFISGAMVAELRDTNQNGDLIQVDGDAFAMAAGSGSTAGVVLYNEGMILLTGSWNLTPGSFDFGTGGAVPGQWMHFGAGANDNSDSTLTPSASFLLNFEGTQYVQTLTMFANAPKGDMNFSPNPTFLDHSSYTGQSLITSSYQYKESEEIEIFNTVSSSFFEFDEKFKYQTFISKIGIYDDQYNLLAIANVATPIKKNSERDFTFKLKLDL